MSLGFSIANTTKVRSMTFRLCFPRLRRVTSPTPTVCRDRCSPFWLLRTALPTSLLSCSLPSFSWFLTATPSYTKHCLSGRSRVVISPPFLKTCLAKDFLCPPKYTCPFTVTFSTTFELCLLEEAYDVGVSLIHCCWAQTSLLKLGIKGSEPHDPKNRWSL